MADSLDTYLHGDDRFNIFHDVVFGLIAAEPSAADLLGNVNDAEGNFTWFLPTDSAFGQFAKSLGYSGSLSNEPAITAFLLNPAESGLTLEQLTTIIDHHISTGGTLAGSISNGATVLMSDGTTVTRNGNLLVDDEPDALNARFVQTDIAVAGGYVHAIDRVLLPTDYAAITAPTLGSLLGDGTYDTNGGDFDLMARFMTTAGLMPLLNNAGADLTLLATTDSGFVSLANGLGFVGSGEGAAYLFLLDAFSLMSYGGSPDALITRMMQHHIVGESLQIDEILARSTLSTNIGTLTVSGSTLVDSDPGFSNSSLVTEIQGDNGVLVGLNRVVLPENIPQPSAVGGIDFRIMGNENDFRNVGGGNDWIDGNGGNDTLNGALGNDVVIGGWGHDTLIGYHGNDLLIGELGNDYLIGGNDFDTLQGGAGADTLSGGTGQDVFVFEDGMTVDRLIDFTNGADRLDVSGLGITQFSEMVPLMRNLPSGHVFMDFGDGDRLYISNLRIAQLDATDFIFA